jgi:hypothetical protein
MKDTKDTLPDYTAMPEVPDRAKIDQLKAKYPEGIYRTDLSFNDEDGVLHKESFIFRKPSQGDAESYQKAVTNGSLFIANLNLLQSVIIGEDPLPLINRLRDYPLAVGKFVNEVFSPFWGSDLTAGKEKL